MNKMTLKRIYPPNMRVIKALTAVQLISMHLFIWRPKAGEDSADPAFGPYISILPRDFGGHPLTWLMLLQLNKANSLHTSLLNSLPPTVLAALQRLHARFLDDWCKVRAFLQSPRFEAIMPKRMSNDLQSLGAFTDFLWAWLNVNTRCIYYRLTHAKTDPDNLTMCPILDFANHTSGQPCMVPVPSDSDIWGAAPVNVIGNGLKFISSNNVKVEESDEILLTYGSHPNRTLFVEYGFVNAFSEDEPFPSGEVDVQDLVESYILANAGLGMAVKAALVAEGYWGDWTLHSTSDGAHPSWRLITTLQLHHLVDTLGTADEDSIQPWRDIVTGKRDQISRENEQSWRKSVVFLCDVLIERAEKSVAGNATWDKEEDNTWVRWMSNNIRLLWKEELFVARAVRGSLLRGDEV